MTQINIEDVEIDTEVPPNARSPIDVEVYNTEGLCPAQWDPEFCRSGLPIAGYCGAEATLQVFINNELVKEHDFCAIVGGVIGEYQTLSVTYTTPEDDHTIKFRIKNFDGEITDVRSIYVTVDEDATLNGEKDGKNIVCIPFTDICMNKYVAIALGGATVFVLASGYARD